MRAVITGAGAIAPAARVRLEPLELPAGKAASAEGFAATDFDLKKHIGTVTSYLDRCTALGLAAVKLALDAAGAADAAQRPADWGLAYATAWGCLDSMELFFTKVAQNPRFAPPLIFTHAYVNSPSSAICIEFGLRGTGATFSEGDTGAITALGWSRDRLLRTAGREVGGVVVAASDALGHARRMLLSAEGDSLGEAGVALTVELDDAAGKRGARPLAVVAGWASCCGPEALSRAAGLALAEAGVAAPGLAGCWSSEPASAGTTGVVCRDLWAAAGHCGPAGALLAIREILTAPPGHYLVAALDRSGGAAAAIIERIL
jgi:hypothetical protein